MGKLKYSQKVTRMLKTYFLLISKLNNQKGATAVEYAIMLAFIAAVIVGVVTIMGMKVLSLFDNFLVALGATGV